MKKFNKIIPFAAIMALCGLLMFACKKDAKPDTAELKVYTDNPNGVYNELSSGFVFVGQQIFGEDSIKIAASVTRAATVDIQAKFVPDTSQIAAYNKTNGTAYAAMPAQAFTLNNNGQFTIKKGAAGSDSVLLIITSPRLLTKANGYLIPLSITSTNGQQGLISSNRSTFFVKVVAKIATLQLEAGSSAGSATQVLNIIPNIGQSFNSPVTFTVNSSVSLPASTTFTVIDRDSLIAVYNTAHSTSLLPVPVGSYTLANGGAATISAGSTASGNFQVTFDATKFPADASKSYLLPLGIKGGDNSAGNLMYIKITGTAATYQLKAGQSAGTTSQQLNITPAGNTFTNPAVTFTLNYSANLPVSTTFSVEDRDALITAYNTANSTSYLPVPAGSYTLANGGAATINAGSATSGNFQVNLDATKFPADGSKYYLLPLGLKGADNSAANLMYVIISPFIQNIDAANPTPAGSPISRTGWSVTTTTAYKPAANMLDGNPATAWDSNTGTETVILDMKTLQIGITGLLISPNYVYTSDNILYMAVYTSTDGTTWTGQGNWTASHNPPGGSSSAPEIENVKFYSAVNARYFKLITSGTSYVGIGELNVVK